jgi:hypothetical protein
VIMRVAAWLDAQSLLSLQLALWIAVAWYTALSYEWHGEPSTNGITANDTLDTRHAPLADLPSDRASCNYTIEGLS